jgi:transposase
MIGDISKAGHIYLACGFTDMRKSIDGLAQTVTYRFNLDPFSNSLFLFCGRRCDRIKALYWEGDGFVLLYKRLEKSRFQWPRTSDEVRNISRQQLKWLVEGLSIDQPKAIQKVARLDIEKR